MRRLRISYIERRMTKDKAALAAQSDCVIELIEFDCARRMSSSSESTVGAEDRCCGHGLTERQTARCLKKRTRLLGFEMNETSLY